MKNIKEYPLFNFDIKEIQKYMHDECYQEIDKKITYLEYLIKKYDEINSPYQAPIDTDIAFILNEEINFWKYVRQLINDAKRPKYKKGNYLDNVKWEIQFAENAIFNVELYEYNLYDFEVEKIVERSKELGSLNNGLIYLTYALKELRINKTLYPKEYIFKEIEGVEKKLIDKISLLKGEIEEFWIDKTNYPQKYILKEIKGLKRELINEINLMKDEIKDEKTFQPAELKVTKQSDDIEKFPSPSELKWNEVTIEFVSNDSARIKARDINKRYTYIDMGLRDGRKRDLPNKLWEILRDGFAQTNGILDWDNANDVIAKGAESKAISNLRIKLKDFFGIEENPIYYDRKQHTYKTKFKIADKSYH